jgi:hypothetical protein
VRPVPATRLRIITAPALERRRLLLVTAILVDLASPGPRPRRGEDAVYDERRVQEAVLALMHVNGRSGPHDPAMTRDALLLRWTTANACAACRTQMDEDRPFAGISAGIAGRRRTRADARGTLPARLRAMSWLLEGTYTPKTSSSCLPTATTACTSRVESVAVRRPRRCGNREAMATP